MKLHVNRACQVTEIALVVIRTRYAYYKFDEILLYLYMYVYSTNRLVNVTLPQSRIFIQIHFIIKTIYEILKFVTKSTFSSSTFVFNNPSINVILQIALRATMLEHENAILRAQIITLREEAQSLRHMLIKQQAPALQSIQRSISSLTPIRLSPPHTATTLDCQI